MNGPQRPTIATAGGGDAGARLAHLQDLVARSCGHAANGLPAVFHECVGAGAMRAQADDGTVLITLITADGESHVFALARPVADALRTELGALRALVQSDLTNASAARRAPIPKPGGRML